MSELTTGWMLFMILVVLYVSAKSTPRDGKK